MSYIGQGLPADSFQGFTTDSFTGDGSATTFTLSKKPFDESALLVVINNVVQKPTTNFTVSGTTLTIVGTAVASGDVIYATHIGGALPIGQAVSVDLNGASDQLILDADADTTISADTDDQIDFKVGGTDEMTLSSTGLVINEGSNDRDVRIETNSSTHAFFVDGGNDKVGIGTDSPVSILTVAGQITATGGAVSAPTYSFDNDSNTGVSRPTTDAINFVAGGSEVARVTSAGIHIGGTGSANALDDYEEGTFTATLGTTGTGFTTTGNTATCFYTKVGRAVSLAVSCSVASPSNGTGNLQLTGLPFASGSLDTGYSAAIRPGRITCTNGDGITANLFQSSSTISFEKAANASATTKIAASDLNGNTTPFLSFSMTYFTD